MEDDFYAQVKWMNNRPKFVQLAKDIKETVLADIDNIPVALLDEPQGELSVAHVHDGDEFCIVDSGLLRFCHGYDCFTDLGPGDCVVILKNRMNGALVLSDSCKYRILSIIVICILIFTFPFHTYFIIIIPFQYFVIMIFIL